MLRKDEDREKRFELMRERMRLQEQAKAAAVQPERPLSRERYDRRERLKNIPAHLEFYRVHEVALMLGISKRSVTKFFRDRAVAFGSERRGTKRPKQTLLISRELLEQWIAEHSPQKIKLAKKKMG